MYSSGEKLDLLSTLTVPSGYKLSKYWWDCMCDGGGPLLPQFRDFLSLLEGKRVKPLLERLATFVLPPKLVFRKAVNVDSFEGNGRG